MNDVHTFIIEVALSSRNTCSHLLERCALIYQKARTNQSEYPIGSSLAFIVGLILVGYSRRTEEKDIDAFFYQNALKELASMRKDGLITEEEFRAKK